MKAAVCWKLRPIICAELRAGICWMQLCVVVKIDCRVVKLIPDCFLFFAGALPNPHRAAVALPTILLSIPASDQHQTRHFATA